MTKNRKLQPVRTCSTFPVFRTDCGNAHKMATMSNLSIYKMATISQAQNTNLPEVRLLKLFILHYSCVTSLKYI